MFRAHYGPQLSILPWVDAVRQAEITEADKQAIFVGNGRALLASNQARP